MKPKTTEGKGIKENNFTVFRDFLVLSENLNSEQTLHIMIRCRELFQPIKKCEHKEGPVGYTQKMNWLETMSKKYDQLKCPECGLFKIWKRNKKMKSLDKPKITKEWVKTYKKLIIGENINDNQKSPSKIKPTPVSREKVKTIRCCSCHKFKRPFDFSKDRSTPSGYSRRCKDCDYLHGLTNQNHRIVWNKNHKGAVYKAVELWKNRNPIKIKAEKIMRDAINGGTLVRQPCEKCGNPKSQGHHSNYDEPLNIIWLCAKHHKQAHGYRLAEDLA